MWKYILHTCKQVQLELYQYNTECNLLFVVHHVQNKLRLWPVSLWWTRDMCLMGPGTCVSWDQGHVSHGTSSENLPSPCPLPAAQLSSVSCRTRRLLCPNPRTGSTSHCTGKHTTGLLHLHGATAPPGGGTTSLHHNIWAENNFHQIPIHLNSAFPWFPFIY